jgi:hypothetical protein
MDCKGFADKRQQIKFGMKGAKSEQLKSEFICLFEIKSIPGDI